MYNAAMLMSNSQNPPPRTPDPRWRALIGLLIALMLVVGGLLLVRVLGRVGRLQDCVMSGRTDCAPIDSSSVGGR